MSASTGAPGQLPAVALDTLDDGTRVRFRPVRPSDVDELRAGLERLSERSRWLRFHAPVASLSSKDLIRLVSVDHHDREAIVAEVSTDEAFRPVAIARYERVDPDEAEAAIVVDDAWQGRGIGRRLLLHLLAAAHTAGIRRMHAEVLAENVLMLRILRSLPFTLTERGEGRTVHLVVHLPSTGVETGAELLEER